MLQTITQDVIAAFIVVVVLTGIAGLVFKRVGEAVFTKALGRIWSMITEGGSDATARRARIRTAHSQLTRTYTILAALAGAGVRQIDPATVADARQAAAQLQVDCPELSEPLTQISRSLMSPINISNQRAHDLLGQVTEGVGKALGPK
jgi:hypothetical protein